VEENLKRRVLHCWEDGPLSEDGRGTTCMLEAGHSGPHEWMRDDKIMVRFKPESLLHGEGG